MTSSRVVFVLLLIVAVALMVVYYPQLPERMASHFDGAGRANGWSSKAFFFGVQVFVLLLVTVCFAILPRRIQTLPPDKINLPNKSYWLAPERREATMASVVSAITWFGCAVLVFLIAVTWLVIRVNLGLESGLPALPMGALLAGLIACVVLLIARMLYIGRRPPG
jgi:serine/threonine-protein kinase